MEYRVNLAKVFLTVLVCCGASSAFAAPTYLKQLPFSNQTDPDHHRPNGWCNDDNACAPGWYCSSFGYCEKR